ncbi:hypothetical protein [Lewinella sp. JB7]|uniref:hypothetical protein n=1 Tax=Lewinella sp. JB7 TaxID=2962887 RepID=UPI0020CA0437|nr:hypothetical protein [Lewinella sp. JB7]MCP9234368.1 hypothetical protein [Lewinella sp. JB7]
MILSLFRTNQSYASLLLFGYALVLQLPVFLLGQAESEGERDTYYGGLVREAVGTSGWVSVLIPALLIAVAGIVANNYADRFRVSRKVTQFPGVFVVLLWALSPAFHAFDPLQFNHLFLLLAIGALGSTYKGKATEVARFNAGFWLGLASLLHPSYLIFIPAFVVGIGIFGTAKLRTVFQLIVGVLIAYFLAGTCAYLLDDLQSFYATQLAGLRFGEFEPAGRYALVGAGLLALPLLIVVLGGNRARLMLNIEGSKNVSFLYWVLLFALPVATCAVVLRVADAQVVVPPLGLLLGLWFTRQPRARAEFYHLLLFAAALVLTTVALID